MQADPPKPYRRSLYGNCRQCPPSVISAGADQEASILLATNYVTTKLPQCTASVYCHDRHSPISRGGLCGEQYQSSWRRNSYRTIVEKKVGIPNNLIRSPGPRPLSIHFKASGPMMLRANTLATRDETELGSERIAKMRKT